jgi:hypothetical protein
MSPRTLRFIFEVGSFLGGALLLLWLFFGDSIAAYWAREPFKFWMITSALGLLAVGGIAKRALRSFHPDAKETKFVDS